MKNKGKNIKLSSNLRNNLIRRKQAKKQLNNQIPKIRNINDMNNADDDINFAK